MIKFEKVSLTYEQKTILKDINLDIKSKERLVILGASGSGKTTLLHLIAGFIAPTKGTIYINNEIVSQNGQIIIPPHKRDISMVFQDLALWNHMSVKGNIEFGLKIKGFSKKERVKKVKEMLELVDMKGFEDRNIDQLSGGQRQRVALARALVLSPKILLMDEPLSSLDRELSLQLQGEILKLQEKLGFTLVYVTHSQKEAENIASKIIKMSTLFMV